MWSVGLSAIRATARIAWDLKVDPGPGFPEPPFVIAPNHYSFLDAPLVGATYGKRARYIALIDLFGNHRVMDWAIDAFEVIPVKRGVVPLGTVRECLAHLEAGGVVGLFPEGRRVERFGDLDPLPGAGWLAARAGVPMVPVVVTGTDQVFGYDNKLQRGKVGVIVGPTLYPEGRDRAAGDGLTRRWADWVGSTIRAPSTR